MRRSCPISVPGKPLTGQVTRALLLAVLFLTAQTAVARESAQELQDPTRGEQVEALLEELAETRERVAELRDGLEGKTGESLRLQTRQLQEEELRGGAIAHELAELVIEAGADGDPLGNARDEVIGLMEAGPEGIQRALDERVALMARRQRKRDEAPPEEAVDLQEAVNEAGRAVDDVFRFYVRHVRFMRKLDLDDSAARQSLTEQLQKRAAELAAFVEVSREQNQAFAERLELNPEDAAAKSGQALVKVRQKGAVDALRRMVDLLQELDADTVEFQELLFTFTGDVSDIGLDTEVVTGVLQEWAEQGRDWLRAEGWSLVVRIAIVLLILFGAWVLARIVRKVVYKALISGRASMSRLLQSMLAGVAANLVLILGFLVALSQLGISIGPMLAGLGIAGFIVGFALQDTLGNFASGVMILIYRPFDEGDVVEAAGVTGTVQTMNLVSTTVLTFDNQTLIVPNSKIWGDVIRNVTHQKTRRVDLVFRVSRDDDVDVVEKILQDIVASDERVLADPAPTIRLHELGDASYDFIVRPWVKTADYWGAYWDLTREVQRRFAAASLQPPRPRRDIRISAEPGGDGTGDPASL